MGECSRPMSKQWRNSGRKVAYASKCSPLSQHRLVMRSYGTGCSVCVLCTGFFMFANHTLVAYIFAFFHYGLFHVCWLRAETIGRHVFALMFVENWFTAPLAWTVHKPRSAISAHTYVPSFTNLKILGSTHEIWKQCIAGIPSSRFHLCYFELTFKFLKITQRNHGEGISNIK